MKFESLKSQSRSTKPQENEKIIFLDRDGVINVDLMGYVTQPKDFHFEEGALEALLLLQENGYKSIIISNQAGVGDGVFTEEAFWDVHNYMLAVLNESGIDIPKAYFCLHGKNAGCTCRKPEIGLFLEAEKQHQFDKSQTYFIGDKYTDIQAGSKFGIKTFFVRTGHGKTDEAKFDENLKPDQKADNFLSATKQLLGITA